MVINRILSISSLLFLAACGLDHPDTGPEESLVSTFAIGDFQPKEGQTPWVAMQLLIEQLSPQTGKVEKSYA